MAEIFGTISAALSVAALFNNAVECFGYIQLGRHYGRDYERCQLKLDIVQARLTKWGDAVCIHDDVRFATTSPTDESTMRAKVILEEISMLFQTARKTSARYEIESTAAAVAQSSWPALHIFHGVLRKKGKERQRQSSFKQKMKWALYDAKEFQRLLASASGFVDDLEKLYPAQQQHREEAILPEGNAVQETMSDTTTQIDQEESRRGSAKSDETVVVQVSESVVVDEKARVRIGNEYSAASVADTLTKKPGLVKAHTIEAKGTSRVQVGNSYGFGSIFDD